MNLFSYIDKYGCYSFDEVEFNEVDNAVFSSLSYVNFGDLVSSNRFHPRTIKSVGDDYFRIHSRHEKNVLATRMGIKTLRYMKDTRRYSNLRLYNYEYLGSHEEMFSAITIEINPRLVYVAFEGTDEMISGWKENLMSSYVFPVSSQRRAIDYINKHFLFRRKRLIVGGHSKGGNLALVASMYANFLVRDRIKVVYSNDGPGLLKSQFESNYFKNIEKKFIHIIPNYSVVGLLLRHSDKNEVVRSFKRGLLAHDITTWVVRRTSFERCELSSFSSKLDVSLEEWLDKYDLKQREEFVLALMGVFEKANIYTLVDLMEHKKLVFKLILDSKDLDKNSKTILREFVLIIFRCLKDVTKEAILSLLDRR